MLRVARPPLFDPSSIGGNAHDPGAVTHAGVHFGDRTMNVEHERQRGLEAGRYRAQHASTHELASITGGSLDHLSEILPPHVSDQFVGGFREAVQRVWRGA